jgi:hypothetical protein
MTMDAFTVSGVVTEILYSIDKVADLHDPQTQDRLVTFMINRRSFPRGIEEYDEAIEQVLRDGRIPPRALGLSTRYSEEEQLRFLGDVHDRMEARKPWPRPAFVKVPVRTWDEMGVGRAVAQITKPAHRLQGVFNNSFDRVPVGDDTMPVMFLELRSGDRVAVIGSVDPRSSVFTLMQQGDGDPAALIARFSDATGIPLDDVRAL